MKLEDRLKVALNKFYDYITERDIIKVADEYSNKRIPKEAREAIYTDLIKLVGANELEVGHKEYYDIDRAITRNRLRAELRKKISEYTGVKE